jgi:hypothetical protein
MGVSSLLPAKIERVFVVDSTGGAKLTKTSDLPNCHQARDLTSGQRHAAWRIGLLAVDKFMTEHGFEPVIGESTTHYGWSKGKFSINVSLREPGNVAYVTSRPGWEWQRTVSGRDVTGAEIYGVTAQVTTLRGMLGGGKYVVMVDVSHVEGGTRNPIFIPLTSDGDKPAHYVYRNVLGVIAMMCNTIPALKTAFEINRVKVAQERQVEDIDV